MASGVADELTARIIWCVIRVHQTLGPGFLETVYRRALAIELRCAGLSVAVEKRIAVYYEGIEVGRHRMDLIVDDRVIVELKTVEAFSKAHYAQVRSYLKATGLDVALLANFAGELADIRRIESSSPGHRPHRIAGCRKGDMEMMEIGGMNGT